MASNRRIPIKRIIVSSVFIVFFAVVLIAIASFSKTPNGQNNGGPHGPQGFDNSLLPKSNIDKYVDKLIAENDNYKMYLTASNLSVSIEDKRNGSLIHTTVKEDREGINKQWVGFIKSGIVLNVIDGYNEAVQADLINNTNLIEITEINNGFKADITFLDYGFRLSMNVTLVGDEMLVEIPDESIKESRDKYHIGAINVFPMMGHSYLGEKEGYMFIPDGNGALIYLNDKEGRLTGGYSQMVYGEDIGFKDQSTQSLLWERHQTVNEAEYVLAPVFGMVHTSDIGYLGIIEGGAERASIEAYPNGVKIPYNRIYPKFVLRRTFKQPTSNSSSGVVDDIEEDRIHYNIKVRYKFVDGNNANYVGLALSFRDYLIEEFHLHKDDSTYNTRIDFIGTEREEWLFSTRNVTMTTIQNIRDIYADLEEEGITDILSIYKGWQKGGINKVPIEKYKTDRNIGKTKDLTRLIKDINESGRKLYLYHDLLRINPDEFNTTFNVVKRIDKRLFEEPTYMQVYEDMLYLIPKRSNYYFEKLVDDYSRAGISDLAIGGITSSIFTFSYSGSEYSRGYTRDAYESMLSKSDDKFGYLLEQPFAYLWKYTDAFLDLPIGTSQYNFVDEEIPFLAISLKGLMPLYSEYMNFEANKEEFFLKLIEMGVYPSFLITWENSSKLIYTNSADIYSSEYSIYKDDIIRYTTALKEVNDSVQGAYIIDHEKLDSGLTIVTYDNGTKIYVNYGNETQPIDGYTVEAMSYKVGESK
ncbi:MAG: hypothetical protein GX321_06060 [Clostridiales bacterium]|nr:hypothetical protein [Clostridiales bacterium]